MESDVWTRDRVHELWRRFVNPDYVGLLESFDYGRHFTWAQGASLRDDAGRQYTDFLAGFGVHNVGHNHPRLLRRLHEAIDSPRPSMLNIDASADAGLLAEALNRATHPQLCRTVFTSGGGEAVEAAIKAARAATGRRMLISCTGAWHGVSTGALSLMGDDEHKQGFGPLLADVIHIPFGDTAALDEACRRHKPAAFFVEPIQGEGGIRVPPAEYLTAVRDVCTKTGCLMVVDEIQTGLGRTGTLFATPFDRVLPDILLVGKALSGGMVPVAACLMTAAVWSNAFSGPARCNLCAATFSGGRLAMVTGLETLRIVEEAQLPVRARKLGTTLLDGLHHLAGKHAIIKDVRGCGLLAGIEFHPAGGLLGAVIPRWARRQLFAQVVAAVLLRDHGFITQTCGLAPTVLRIEPPLVITADEIERLLDALDKVLTAYPSYTAATGAAIRKTVLGREL
ncbi:MAG: aspartate aminotransferase family protein [Tepidisphaerales bacterium]